MREGLGKPGQGRDLSAEHEPHPHGQKNDLKRGETAGPEKVRFRLHHAAGGSGSPLKPIEAAAVEVAAVRTLLESAPRGSSFDGVRHDKKPLRLLLTLRE